MITHTLTVFIEHGIMHGSYTMRDANENPRIALSSDPVFDHVCYATVHNNYWYPL